MRTIGDAGTSGFESAAIDAPEAMLRRIEELEDANLLLRQWLSLTCGAVKIGLWEYDFRKRKLWVSDELAALYGLAMEEVSWPDFASRVHPDDLVEALARPTPSFPFGRVNEFLIRVRHADGEYRTIRSRSVTIGREGGEPERKLGVHTDLSQDTLLRLNDELAEANERLRSFTYLASHDLRSPLRGIEQIITIVDEECGGELPPFAADMLDKVRGRARRMTEMVGKLQEFATCDLADIAPEPCDIDRLLRDVAATTDTRGKDLTLRCEVTQRCQVVVSPLTICVRNLIDNACKHHDRAAGTVAVEARTDDRWLTIQITDDGPGISDTERKKIFEPFYTTDHELGTGLGLAHVDRTVRKYLATLDCESEVGRGTTFTLRWPI